MFTQEALDVSGLHGPAVVKRGAQLISISTLGARGTLTTWTANVFVDASYEGDLAVGANVSYTYGRESNET